MHVQYVESARVWSAGCCGFESHLGKFFSMEEGVVLGCVVCVCLDLVDETRPHQFQNTTYQVEMEPYAYCVARFIMPS